MWWPVRERGDGDLLGGSGGDDLAAGRAAFGAEADGG
jgi:hypothetical protein